MINNFPKLNITSGHRCRHVDVLMVVLKGCFFSLDQICTGWTWEILSNAFLYDVTPFMDTQIINQKCLNMFVMCLGDCPLPCSHPAVSQLPALRPDPHHYPTIDEPLPPSEFARLTAHTS